MQSVIELARKIQSIGFSCIRCGECCRDTGESAPIVMAGPGEIRRITSASGREWSEVAEPYPEFIDAGNETEFTLGWCLKRVGGRCTFFSDNGCAVYQERPWICRTYPFMLDGDALIVSECRGLGSPMGWDDAVSIASHLIERRDMEHREEESLKAVYKRTAMPRGRRLVIDSEGVTYL